MMRFVSVLTLFLCTAAAAQEPVSAKLVSDPFLESYQPEVSVSGNVIVGVMTAAAATAMLDDDIAVYSAPTATEADVCLRVASRDGIYTSKNIYALPTGAEGPVRLPYRSKLANVVEAYGADEIALAATAGECDSGSTDFFLLSAATQAEPSGVLIYLNSFGATDVFYELESGISECEYISEGRRTTYDFICRLEPVPEADKVPVTIIRERFGREQPSVEMTIIGNSQ